MAELDDVLSLAWEGGRPQPAVGPAVVGSVVVGRGELDEGWLIGHAINGGVLMALGTRAASEVLAGARHTDPLTWGAHFLSAAVAGPVEVHVEPLRTGRSVSTVSVRVLQPGGAGKGLLERVRLVGTFGDLGRADPVRRAPSPPSVPGPDECLPARRDAAHAERGTPPVARSIVMLDRLDVRVDPATAGFAVGRPSRRGVIRAWLRMADGRKPDAAMLPYAVDALMPVSFDLGVPGWAPTLELTGQVLGRPAPGWLLVELTTDTVVGDLVVEDACVWDSTGRLVARSRQLASVRFPAEDAASGGGSDAG
ncbi:thioesterase family protein [Oryzobacter sp. R7]|uniref:thioesterase family protein n=1 Tax=Oryzobacter faecalis TaxID=3388656 RepID=UPI00398CF4F6